jgi:hypothetical protein
MIRIWLQLTTGWLGWAVQERATRYRWLIVRTMNSTMSCFRLLLLLVRIGALISLRASDVDRLMRSVCRLGWTIQIRCDLDSLQRLSLSLGFVWLFSFWLVVGVKSATVLVLS